MNEAEKEKNSSNKLIFQDWIQDGEEKRFLQIYEDGKVFINQIRCYTIKEAWREINNK